MTRFLNEETGELFGASFHVHPDPQEAAAKIIDCSGAGDARWESTRRPSAS